MILIIILIFSSAFIFYFYNKKVRLYTLMQEGESTVTVLLKKRYDLIPQLVETTKAYCQYEQTALIKVVQARALAVKIDTLSQKGRIEEDLSQSVKQVLALKENYPDLKANTEFLSLQKELIQVEDDIQLARRYYNATVRNYNTFTHTFPMSLFLPYMQIKKGDFFEAESSVREGVSVKGKL